MKLIWLIFILFVLAYNAFYDFLPAYLQSKVWIRSINLLSIVVLLLYSGSEIIAKYTDYSFAIVSPEGKVLKRKNFSWPIKKTADPEGNIIFIIEGRYGDASEIKVTPRRMVRFETYNAMVGIGIKFFCRNDELSEMKIEIKK